MSRHDRKDERDRQRRVRIQTNSISIRAYADTSQIDKLESGRIEQVVANVNQLKQERRFEEALTLLLGEITFWERDSATGLGGVAPWYYEQAAIIYRKSVATMTRLRSLNVLLLRSIARRIPPRLLERLEKAKGSARKRAGVDGHSSAAFKQEVGPTTEPARPSRLKVAKEQAPIRDFIALDVETANADFASICSIGLVHFREGHVFKSLTILVDPEDEFDPINISIHGITPEIVVGKPTIGQSLSRDRTVTRGCRRGPSESLRQRRP